MPSESIFPRERVTIVGVLNCTPDSFSRDGLVGAAGPDRDELLTRAKALLLGGADVLDVGGESTRPGASDVSVACEIERTAAAVGWLVAELPAPVSIDTRKAAVARVACEAGARIVNDVSGGVHDPSLLAVAAEFGAHLILGHMPAGPATMHQIPRSDDILRDVVDALTDSIAAAERVGVARERIVADPGIGFGKSPQQNFELLAHAGWLGERLGVPVLVGPSRKGFLGSLTGDPVEERDAASHAACAVAVFAGANAVRVHEAGGARRAVQVARAAREARRKELT